MNIQPITFITCSQIEAIGQKCLPIYYKKENLLYLLLSPKYRLYSIQDNKNSSTIIGFIIYEFLTETVMSTIQICSLAILPQYRRQGYAKQLLTFMINQHPKTNFCLHVLEENNSAINLYKKMGFYQKRFVSNYYDTLQKNAYFFERIK